jgi:N-acyl homoserine lactone hydrolase
MVEITLSIVDCGPLNLEKNKLVAFGKGMLSIPTVVGIIHHSKHGLILWDTGINHIVADPEAAEAYWGAGIPGAFGSHKFTREHAIDKQLEKLGYKCKDVKYVVYSHMHLDHAGGMCYFPDAIHVVQRDEIRYALWPDLWTRPVYCQNDFKMLFNINILDVDGDIDLFDDGFFRLVKTPGHTPGHQSLILDLPNRGRICLAGDIAHQRDQFEAMIPMPWDWSTSAMNSTRLRMKQLERSGVPLFLCHEPKDFERLPHDGATWD